MRTPPNFPLMFHVKHYATLTLLSILFVASAGCTVSKNPISGNKRAYGYSWEQEIQIGREADAQIQQQFGIYDDPELANYVNQIGQQVLRESHLRGEGVDEAFRNTEFTFRVLDSPVVNAFALPGGFVYVTRGLLTHLDNEAQLAVVLGHEIVHVAARHASKRAFEAQAGNLGLITGAILGQQVLGGSAADAILNLGSQATQLLMLSHGRDDERESDRHGVAYAAQAGYQAGEGAEFFRSLKRINEKSGSGLPTFLSTHPDPGEREEKILEMAAEWQTRTNMTKVDADDYMRHIEGMIMGENPRQGFTENGIFYHPELQFQFAVPSGFQVQNEASYVAMVDANQQAIIVFAIDPSGSPQEAATKFAQQEGMRVQDSGTDNVNGMNATYVLVTAQTQNGQEIAALSYYISYNNRTYNFLAYTASQAYRQYEGAFRQAIRNFAPLRDQRILSVQPTRTRVIRADRAAAFSSFLPSRLPDKMTAEDLAIMNQVEVNETIQPGEYLKLPL